MFIESLIDEFRTNNQQWNKKILFDYKKASNGLLKSMNQKGYGT